MFSNPPASDTTEPDQASHAADHQHENTTALCHPPRLPARTVTHEIGSGLQPAPSAAGGPGNHRTRAARSQRRTFSAQTTGLDIDCRGAGYRPKGKAVGVRRLDVTGEGKHRDPHRSTKLRGLPVEDDFLISRTTVIGSSGLMVLSTAHKRESLPQRGDLVTLSCFSFKRRTRSNAYQALLLCGEVWKPGQN